MVLGISLRDYTGCASYAKVAYITLPQTYLLGRFSHALILRRLKARMKAKEEEGVT